MGLYCCRRFRVEDFRRNLLSVSKAGVSRNALNAVLFYCFFNHLLLQQLFQFMHRSGLEDMADLDINKARDFLISSAMLVGYRPAER